jgi:hypothetical protein
MYVLYRLYLSQIFPEAVLYMAVSDDYLETPYDNFGVGEVLMQVMKQGDKTD